VSDAELAALARSQYGLVSTEQARRHLSIDQIRYRRRVGRLQGVHPNVLRIAGAPESWEASAMAAVLAAGRRTVVSFRAAAYLWMLAGPWVTPVVEVTTPTRRRVRMSGVVVHDSWILDDIHVDRHRGIPVTSVARTLCDLTACCSPNEVGRALDDALRRRLVSLTQVQAVFEDLAERGRRRSTLMRGLLDARGPEFHPGDSDPEVRIVRVLVGAGLPRPVQQHRVRIDGRTYRLDGAYPEYQVGIEYEGFEFHTSRTAFDDRYERDRLLKRARWSIVYVTSRTSDEHLVRDTTDALRSRGYPNAPMLPPPSTV
jgi:hypothetical protein